MRVVKGREPNPKTGMYDMAIAIEPGDQVVLIKGEDHIPVTDPVMVLPGDRKLHFKIPWKASGEPIGWGILDDSGKIVAWMWIDNDIGPLYWRDSVEINVEVGV